MNKKIEKYKDDLFKEIQRNIGGRMTNRELDALVATEVMGLDFDFSDKLEDIPSYSTDIKAAWEVVEKVQSDNKGWRFSLLGGDERFGYKDGSPSKGVDTNSRIFFGWSAEFFGHFDPRENYGQGHGSAKADTAPMAICLAALKAKGVKYE